MSNEQQQPEKLTDLQAQLDKDLIIDPSHLMSEAASNITKHATYYHKLAGWRAKSKMADLELLALVKERYNHYAGSHDGPVYSYNLSAGGITKNVEGDKQVIEKQMGNMMIQLKVEFYTKACDLFKDRGFAIKNMIDIMKFQNGD